MRNLCVSFKGDFLTMCFSVKIPQNIQQLELDFKAEISVNDAVKVQNLFKTQSQMTKDHFKSLMAKEKFRPSGLPYGKFLGPFRQPERDGRILPGSFANVILMENGKRVIKPMRFQIRPTGSDGETDGVYNARIESLTTKDIWRPLFMRRHALVPFISFY